MESSEFNMKKVNSKPDKMKLIIVSSGRSAYSLCYTDFDRHQIT